MNWVLWLSCIWLPAFMCVILRNNAKFKKNIAVGVTLPLEGRTHPEVTAALDRYKKQQIEAAAILTLLGIPGMFLKFQLSFQLWFVWLTLVMAVPVLPFILCNRELKRIKEEQGWKQEPQPIAVDMSAMPQFRFLSPWVFAPAVVIALLPVLWDSDGIVVYSIMAAMIVLFWVLYRYALRQKSERIDDNMKLTQALTRIRVCQWSKMWLISAYCMAGMNLGLSLALYSAIGMAAVLIVFTAILVAACLYFEMRTRTLQEKLTAGSGSGYYVDDDDKWLWGLVYYNPDDSRLIVNERVGNNTSVNLAKPAGKVLYVLLALLVLTLPAWGLFLGGEVSGELTDTQAIVTAGNYGLAFDLDDSYEVTLLEELPDMRRDFGNGMPELLSGEFTSKEYGKLNVCLNPTVGPWLLVDNGEELYLIGTQSSNMTLEIYEALKSKPPVEPVV